MILFLHQKEVYAVISTIIENDIMNIKPVLKNKAWSQNKHIYRFKCNIYHLFH